MRCVMASGRAARRVTARVPLTLTHRSTDPYTAPHPPRFPQSLRPLLQRAALHDEPCAPTLPHRNLTPSPQGHLRLLLQIGQKEVVLAAVQPAVVRLHRTRGVLHRAARPVAATQHVGPRLVEAIVTAEGLRAAAVAAVHVNEELRR